MDKGNMMNFYDIVTPDNALAWYEDLPVHLKKQLDVQLISVVKADVHVEHQKLDKDISTDVSAVLGYDIPQYVKVNREEGNLPDEIERFDLRRKWCAQYNEHTTLLLILKEAPRIQKERKMLAEALGLSGTGKLPDQGDGLDDTQAATVRWIQSTGQTPIEFLADTYRNEELKPNDRIAAARAMLDYVHKKVPTKQEIETNTGAPKIDPAMLRGLTPAELDVLEALVKKMSKS